MSDSTSALDGTVFGDRRRAIPAIVAFAAILVAEATLEGWAAAGAAFATLAAFFAAIAYLDRSPRGAECRQAREALSASLDATESRAREIANWSPFVIAVAIGVAVGDGVDATGFLGALVIGFLLSQAAFVLWLRARRSRGAPSAR